MAGKWEKTRVPGIYVQQNLRTGKPRYKAAYRDSRGVVTSKTFPTVKLADAHLHEMHVRRATGSLPDSSMTKKTVHDLWTHMVKTSRAKPSTAAWYESHWRNYVEEELGARRVGSLRRADFEAFLADVETRTGVATRRAVQQLVHKLFAVAVRSEWIIRNPVDGIEMPAARPRPAQFLTEGEVDRVAAEVPPRYRALVYTLAEGGIRIGEALALRVKNMNGSIRIVENSVEVGGRRFLGEPKTAGSERVVPVSPKLRAILQDHLDTYVNCSDTESFVFTTEHGAQVGQNNFRKRVFQPAARRAQVVPTPTVHQLRHTAASLWLQRGLSPWEVAKMLGHSDTKMVERTYGHLYVDALQQKIDSLSPGSP